MDDRERTLARSREKTAKVHLSAGEVSYAPDAHSHCTNCGAPVERDAVFCEECGAPLKGNICESCGASLKPDIAICPECGRPATSHCSFCGSLMNRGDSFCDECGNPRSGITCARCGTLNFRSFCRKCNYPLNPMALHAVEEAKRDPHFKKASALALEVTEIEEQIALLEQQLKEPDKFFTESEDLQDNGKLLEIEAGTSDDTRRLLDEFEKLQGIETRDPEPLKREIHSPVSSSKMTLADMPSSKPVQDKRGGLSGSFRAASAQIEAAAKKLENLRQQYKSKVEELQKELDAMIPPVDAPPEIKRNFACARKITVETEVRTQERVAWVCNKCQIWHNNPSECGVREFGGKWVFGDVVKKGFGEATINI